MDGKRNNSRIRFITQTAVMLALLIGVQYVTRPFGTFVTGSLVNLILLVSAFVIGVPSGLTVGALSTLLAFLAGIGPAFIQIVPFVAVGNIIFVLVAQLARAHIAKADTRSVALAAAALAAAGAAKTLFLWVGLVAVALPLIPGLNEKQVAVIGTAFTWPQFVTSLIGSALAMLLVPLLKKALAQYTRKQ